jgi:aerobic-type carbon monoxide dehydrogenase small subunit (CoxS/CutS family)
MKPRPAPVTLHVNGRRVAVPGLDPSTPLLWVLRDRLGLTGTKFGCGRALCGACTVHRNGVAVPSCTLSVGDATNCEITTIEGLSKSGDHPVQRAWAELDVAQCGFCQPGQIMAAASLLARTPTPTEDDIVTAMSTNICRCGTYTRIRAAIERAARAMGSQ